MTPFCMLFDIVFTLIVDLNVVITFVSLSTMTAQPHAGMMGGGGVYHCLRPQAWRRSIHGPTEIGVIN